MKMAAVAPRIVLGNVEKNTEAVLSAMRSAHAAGAEWLILPSLCLCGCTCGSLLEQSLLGEQCEAAVEKLRRASADLPGMATLLPTLRTVGEETIRRADILLNGSALEGAELAAGGLLALPWEEKGEKLLLVSLPETPGTVDSRTTLCAEALSLSQEGVAVVLCPGEGESGNDGVYTGGVAMAAEGRLLGWAEGEMLLCDTEGEGLPPVAWEETLCADPYFPGDEADTAARCQRILALQSRALAERMERSGCRGLVLGLSGGLDSAWSLLLGVEALERLSLPPTALLAVTMPGFGTIGRTRSNAEIMAEALGVRFREIPIGEAVAQHLSAIGHALENRNVTYENAQARERTQILMDLANDENALVLGTGDLSELALGWCTYNGDHMSMYAPSGALPKTAIRRCVRWYVRHRANEALGSALLDVLDTPVSPELLPGAGEGISQSTEAILGPYELHDFFIYHFLRHGAKPSELYGDGCQVFAGRYDAATVEATLRTFLRRFFTQQFKRSCLCDGPVLWEGVSLSPRGAWRMPSDMSGAPWLAELDAALQ